MKDRIEAAYKAWNDAFNRGDAETVTSFYAADAILLPPTHQIVEGTLPIKAFWDGLFKFGMTDHTLELVKVEADQRGVAAIAKWTAKAVGKDGKERTFNGSVAHMFEEQDAGGLKIWLHSWN